MKRYQKSHPRGFTITEVLVALVILFVMALGVGSIMSQSYKMKKQLQSKLETATLQAAIQTLFASREDCDCQLKGLTFDLGATDKKIELSSLKMSCGASARDFIKVTSAATSNAEHTVKRIYVEDIVPTGNSNEYSASLYMEPETLPQVVPVRSIPIRFRFNTDPASPNIAKAIAGCGPAPLSIPYNLKVVPGDKQCRIEWGESAGAKPITYAIRRSVTQGKASEGVTACLDTGSTSCTASGLINGEIYYFSVQTKNPYSKSKWSPEISCEPFQPPSEPKLTATAGTAACTLKIEKPSQGTAPLTYTVYRSETTTVTKDSTVVCSRIPSTGNFTTSEASGLENGKKYYFAASAENQAQSNLSLPIECEPIAPCSGSVTVTLIDPGGCRLSRRAGDYNSLVLNGIQSRAGGTSYVVSGQMYVSGDSPCATVYCPINFTCDKGMLVPNKVNLDCSRTVMTGTQVDTLPSKQNNPTAGWMNMILLKK